MGTPSKIRTSVNVDQLFMGGEKITSVNTRVIGGNYTIEAVILKFSNGSELQIDLERKETAKPTVYTRDVSELQTSAEVEFANGFVARWGWFSPVHDDEGEIIHWDYVENGITYRVFND